MEQHRNVALLIPHRTHRNKKISRTPKREDSWGMQCQLNKMSAFPRSRCDFLKHLRAQLRSGLQVPFSSHLDSFVLLWSVLVNFLASVGHYWSVSVRLGVKWKCCKLLTLYSWHWVKLDQLGQFGPVLVSLSQYWLVWVRSLGMGRLVCTTRAAGGARKYWKHKAKVKDPLMLNLHYFVDCFVSGGKTSWGWNTDKTFFISSWRQVELSASEGGQTLSHP